MASFSKSGLYWKCTPSFDITKPTLIFLHASWLSSTMFEETVAHLLALLPDTNMLCVDLNGHCQTTTGRKIFTLWDQGDDAVALMVCPDKT
jgi:3-oxoadipate enol-lactonase